MAEFESGSWGPESHLQQEIERLWAKVSNPPAAASSEPPLPPVSESAVAPLAWEAVSLIKGRYRKESRDWAEMLEAKEKELSSLHERYAQLEKHIAGLRWELESKESENIDATVEAKARLESSIAALREGKERHEQDQMGLKIILEQTRERMRAESELWKKERVQWEKQEQQYLLDLKELQTGAARHQDEISHSSDESRRLADSLKEAKNALEKTLAELLRERQIREETEKERAKALQKVDEVEKHFQELSKIWEEERSQWRELWDRERSTWETQRTEFADWEQKLRQEREAWHAELQAKEQEQIRYAAQMAETLRQSTEASTRIQAVLKSMGLLNPGVGGLRFKPSARFWSAAAFCCLAVAAAFPLWRYYSMFHFKKISVVATTLQNPTGVAYDGRKIWVTQWDGSLAGFAPGSLGLPQISAHPAISAPYHPVSAVFGEESLWTLDAAQARLVRHVADDPQQVISSRQSAGPAPTALAFDGKTLWGYDAANRAIARYNPEGDSTSFPLENLIPTSLLWVSGQLWAFDSKSRVLAVLSLKNGEFKIDQRYELGEAILGMMAVKVGNERQFWILAGPSEERSTPAFVKYSY